jgi:hypothetical protein
MQYIGKKTKIPLLNNDSGQYNKESFGRSGKP